MCIWPAPFILFGNNSFFQQFDVAQYWSVNGTFKVNVLIELIHKRIFPLGLHTTIVSTLFFVSAMM